MQLIISGRGVVLTTAFKALVERKAARLTRIGPPTLELRVTCGSERFQRTAVARWMATASTRTSRNTYPTRTVRQRSPTPGVFAYGIAMRMPPSSPAPSTMMAASIAVDAPCSVDRANPSAPVIRRTNMSRCIAQTTHIHGFSVPISPGRAS